MKKHFIICYLIIFIGLAVGITVLVYSNFYHELRFKYPILWGASVLTLIAAIRLSHLKQIKNKWVYYYTCIIMVIMFILSLFDGEK